MASSSRVGCKFTILQTLGIGQDIIFKTQPNTEKFGNPMQPIYGAIVNTYAGSYNNSEPINQSPIGSYKAYTGGTNTFIRMTFICAPLWRTDSFVWDHFGWFQV